MKNKSSTEATLHPPGPPNGKLKTRLGLQAYKNERITIQLQLQLCTIARIFIL